MEGSCWFPHCWRFAFLIEKIFVWQNSSYFCHRLKMSPLTNVRSTWPFWPPLRPWFVKKTAFFSAKAQNLRIRRSRILGWECPFMFWTVFAAFATRFCQKNSVSLCKGTKLKNSAKPNSGTVRRFPVLSAALCKSSRILQSRILGQYVGSRFGMFFRLWNRRSD